MAVKRKINKPVEISEEQRRELEAEKERKRIENEYKDYLSSFYEKIKKVSILLYPDKRERYSIMKDGEVYECSKDTYLEHNKDLLGCRVYSMFNSISLIPTLEELEKVKDFWDSLTDNEKQSVEDWVKQYNEKNGINTNSSRKWVRVSLTDNKKTIS